MRIGQTIIKIRQDNKLTQEDFAKKFNVTRQTVSNWENEKSYPDLLTLIKISDDFDCSLDSMLKDNPDMTEKMNENMKYGEQMSAAGGICGIFLFIWVIECMILQYGSRYIWIGILIIIFLSSDSIGFIMGAAKKGSNKDKVRFWSFYLAFAVLSFGVIYYIR